MTLTRQKAVAVYQEPERLPIVNQLEAWMVADTLAQRLVYPLPDREAAQFLKGLALELADWCESESHEL